MSAKEFVAVAQKIRVWDLPTRLFHWLLALGVLAAFLTEEFGEIEWHARVGYFLLSLIVFRVAWGFWGSRYARFSAFVPRPATLLRFLKTPWTTLGHNPLGSLSVLALLGLVLAQIVTGLASTDEILFDGPLVKHLPEDWVALAGSLHEWFQGGLLALIGLHVAAILFYRWVKKEALLPAMITGDKSVSETGLESELAASERATSVRTTMEPAALDLAASDSFKTRALGLLTYLAALGLVLLLLDYLSL